MTSTTIPSGSFPFPSSRSAHTLPVRRLRLAWREARPVVPALFLLRFAAGAVLGAAAGARVRGSSGSALSTRRVLQDAFLTRRGDVLET